MSSLAYGGIGVLLVALATWASVGLARSGDRPTTAPVSQPDAASNIVDLTHTLTPEFPYIPIPGVTFPFKLTPIATLEEHGVAANRWEIHEHLGTQIDAPSHFIAGGLTLEQMPARSFIAPLAVIDISGRARTNPDAVVTVADIRAWEAAHGPLPQGAVVFMYSGWESRVGDPTAFLNTDSAGTWHFPGFSEEAAAFLLKERDVVGLGVDVISLDPGRDRSYATHRTWLGANKWAVECVANLAQVPPSGATVFVGATKVGGATGGPVRIIATWRSESSGAGAPATPVIHQHVGGSPDAFANAYLIETATGVIAVDATMTAAEGARIRARLVALRKPLLAVLLTHPHPDHYGGVTSLVGPDRIPILATAAVDRIIRRDSTLTPAGKQRLERRMAAYVVGDRLAAFVSRGADAVAAELARETRR